MAQLKFWMLDNSYIGYNVMEISCDLYKIVHCLAFRFFYLTAQFEFGANVKCDVTDLYSFFFHWSLGEWSPNQSNCA